MKVRIGIGLFTVWFFCATLPLAGQEARGTLLGRVTDPTGAVIVGAKIDIISTATAVHYSATTSGSGDYIVPFLIPGPYSLTVEMQGFKTSTQSGIAVRQSDRITIDVTMQLGQASDSIQVTGETPLVDTSTASMGQVVESRTILDLPTKDSMVLVMATLVPGVTFTPQTGAYIRPFDTGSPSTISVNGVRSGNNEFMLDGANNTQGQQIAYSPPQALVEEFKVQTATFDAAFGFMPGAAVNMTLKSGTNQLHGQVNYFIQNPALNANNYFRLTAGKPAMRIHRGSASLTGPVDIPKVYDGHNKTFFTAGFEYIYSFDPSPWVVESVPTPAERGGDFSSLLKLGANYQIYNPFSIAPVGNGQFSRTPVPNNVIPASQINPVAANIAKLWDPANQQGTADGTNNYTMAKNAQDTYDNELVRLDHNVSDKERFYFRTNFTRLERPENIRQGNTDGDNFYRFNRGASFDNVYIFSPRFFMDSRFTVMRFYTGYTPYQEGWDLSTLGFSPAYVSAIKALEPRALKFPQINVSGQSALGGVNTYNEQFYNTYEFALNLTNMVGGHTLRYGGGYRIYQLNQFDLSNSSGNLAADSTYTNGPFNNSAAAPIGQGMASFLYGILSPSSSFPISPTNLAISDKYWSFYFQDDWKLSPKLTLSAGLRYELPTPLTERFNRSVADFDAKGASPIVNQVMQNYAQNPIPQVPASQFNVLGGLTFPGVGGASRNLWNSYKKQLMPRVGLAYSITPKTVIRTGYGIYFQQLGIVNVGGSGAGGGGGGVLNQAGFGSTTSFVGSTDNGQTYVANLTNPFPGGFVAPTGSSAGLSTFQGQSISFYPKSMKNPYMQRWQFAVQQQLPFTSLIEMSYVGNRSTRLLATQDLDAIPRQYLSTLPTRDQTTINLLNSQVANPFYPLLPRTNLAATTVALSQLLRPNPQFSGITALENSGFSWFHSFQGRIEKRFSKGLAAQYSFTWAKWMQATSYLNATDRIPEKVISDLDRPFRHVLTAIYELPFGPHKNLLSSGNKAIGHIVGGWQVQGVFTHQSGAALGFGNALLNPGQTMANVALPADQRSVTQWFNVSAFNRVSNQQLASNVQSLSSAFSGVRAPPVNNWDFSMIKNSQIKERLRVQFTAAFINALNHPQFVPPNTTPTSTAFGQLTGAYNWQRIIQFGIKLSF
jgi:Carboxypeptidase regulatory-like domain/TonB dependent receptor